MSTIPTENWRELLDEKQRKEIAWASTYATDFGHGTVGHNQLLLIAHLAGLLDQLARDGVLSRPEPPLSAEIVLNFGKYTGKTLGQIHAIDSDYVRWLSEKARDDDVRQAALELLGQATLRAPITNAVLQGPLIEDSDAPPPADPGVDIPF